jgi:DNA-binding transcriptional MerR regulator
MTPPRRGKAMAPRRDSGTESRSDGAGEEAARDSREYTIDELAAASGVPSRTIRFYQSKRALPAPTIHGRVAYYADRHLQRLALIGRLQDQGLRIRAIREVLERMDRGELDIHKWLGFSAELQRPWAEDRPRVLAPDALTDLIGSWRDGLLAELIRLDLVKPEGDRYLVTSPGLLAVAMKLERAGVELKTSVAGARTLRKHLTKAAAELADQFLRRGAPDLAPDGRANSVERVMETLRPLGLDAVQLIFAQEMEGILRKRMESGKTQPR